MNKFNLNDKVATAKTGLPGVGIIVGIMNGSFYALRKDVPAWDEQFPSWKQKCVYYIFFENLRKNASLEEYRKFYPELSEEELLDSYNKTPEFNFLTYCEDDLELFEKADGSKHFFHIRSK